jgi:hypothetical protein
MERYRIREMNGEKCMKRNQWREIDAWREVNEKRWMKTNRWKDG